MDKEALRKEIYAEMHSEYDSKLREAKKQKSQIEEELESSAEKWRTERRRLNSEVDRLESALADAREARRKASDAKTSRVADTQDSAKVQTAADERLKKATGEWDDERAKLEDEISRLQRGVAELLERANNPLRAGQAAREQLELRLEEALKSKRQAEDALLAAQAEWEKEKLKLAGDMVKIRRFLGQEKAPKGAVVEEDRSREKELEKQLAEAVRKSEELERDLKKARAEAKNTTGKETAIAPPALERDLKKAQQEAAQAKKAQSEEIQRLTAQLATIRDAGAKEYASQIERELQKAQKDIGLIKESQATDLERQSMQLEESQKAHARIKELERRIAEGKGSAGKETTERLEKQVAEGTSTRQSLERDLQTAQQEALQLKEKQPGDLRRVTARVEESQTEIQQLERQLEETRDAVSTEVVEQLRRQDDERMQKIFARRPSFQSNSTAPALLLEAERSRFATAAAAQSKSKPDKKAASSPTLDADTLNAELARVEAMVAGIAGLIDDPSTELSVVIRKNVERAELDAYLKGILFSLGRSRGL